MAAEFNQQGYVNAKALLGGVAAWQQAGFPVVAANPDSPQAKRFVEIAQALSEQVTQANLKTGLTHVKPVFSLKQV